VGRTGGERESAGPGQFLARRERGRKEGDGSRGMPRRRITEALATARPSLADI
jgi:hypothetical protein